jgi:hypothetical protein
MKIGNQTFPEMSCLCPIYTGRALADLNGGNMNGTCETSNPKQNIWSEYAPIAEIPQLIQNWKCTEQAAFAPVLYCERNATDSIWNTDVNCFSMLCSRIAPIQGIEMANCSCPLLEDLSGDRNSGKRFVTQAGQGNSEYCSQNPVGMQTLILETWDKLTSSEIFPIWQQLNNATLVSRTCKLS